MSLKEGAPALLVAESLRLRRDYEKLLGDDLGVRAPEPREIDVEAMVDAGAVILVLEGARGDASLEMLEGVCSRLSGAAPLLVAVDCDDELLERALASLRPRQVVSHPCPRSLLRFALEQARPARSARDQHRPARALLGVSSAIHGVMEEIAKVAPTRANVLVLGETGTGKELVARAVHQQSTRGDRPFVAVNCGALAETLLEAELFGFEKGAFTGATQSKRGLFREADGGTLFLDEIGETSPALQVKMLRAIEAGEIRPIGSTEIHRVDARIVSATNRDLEDSIERGAFRQDLYYRLNAVTLWIPPLRRRRTDIAFLAQHFAEELGEEYARRIVLGEDFLEALSQRDLPGNVRELRNTVERAIALATPGEPVGVGELPPDVTGRPTFVAMGTLRDRIIQVELHAIREALETSGGNRTHAAEILGLSRPGLRQKMKRYGLE